MVPLVKISLWDYKSIAKQLVFLKATSRSQNRRVSSSLFTDIIATATSDNIFVKKSGGGIERSPMSRHKQGKMAKNV